MVPIMKKFATRAEEIRYEGYGPAGVAFIVDCLSDNRNRTVADVRHAFSKAGGNLGQTGSVAYMFTSLGVLIYSPEHDEDDVMEAALDAGAEDIIVADDGSIEVVTAAEDYVAVKQAMTDRGRGLCRGEAGDDRRRSRTGRFRFNHARID